MSTKSELQRSIDGGAIPPFVYCYPVRSSYRPLDPERAVEAIWEEDLSHSPTRELNLYLHVPFCRYKCGFCNLYTVISEDADVYDAYTEALCADIRRHAPVIRDRRLRTVYIGGGTPSLLHRRNFDQIFDTLTEVYPNWRSTTEEVAVEATPDSIVDRPDTLRHLIARGLTRVNMGIQSLRPQEIREAGRGQANERTVRKAIEIVKTTELANLSTDLIMGFAGQDDQSWRESVDELVELAPETISTYFLTIRPDAWFSKTGRYRYMRNGALYERYDYAQEKLLSAGYVQESNVRYKKPGRGGYVQKVLQFHGVPVLGLGSGARTYTNTVDYIVGGSANPNLAEVGDYIRGANAGVLAPRAGFVYDDVERIRKRLALDLFDLNLRDLDRYGYREHAHLFEPVLLAAEELGLLTRLPGDRVQLTRIGFKYRDIISWMFYSPEVVRLDEEFYRELHNQNSRATRLLGNPSFISGLSSAAV
ncbi:coproporphyrinogen-III oxidase family protein [Streptosporangium saharense]|uniref:Heme chaperone HemW n=1 Tax=Streptosporangium saharense TaxID=1706840 RepID=A0A7W7QGA0_9ACTN|nr:radical SAM protein [Streptosporangium saharense]MBB4913030.1 oxygen-independent coproporphyrinogen-3 oxidase [Streptosporangium saharense]